MSTETIVYGIIEGAFYTIDDHYRDLQDENVRILQSLPEHDSWPYLTRQLFAVPGSTAEGGLHRTQVIHFGASFKNFEDDFREWRQKFEALLRRLYWFSATVHVDTQYYGEFSGVWCISREALDALQDSPPAPVGSWSFEGNLDQIPA